MDAMVSMMKPYLDVPIEDVLGQDDLFGKPPAVEQELRRLAACPAAELEKLADRLLTESLHTLLDQRETEENRWDVWTWVHSKDWEYPLSFHRCAFAAGVDPEELREQLIALLLQRDAVPEEPTDLVLLGNAQRPLNAAAAAGRVAA